MKSGITESKNRKLMSKKNPANEHGEISEGPSLMGRIWSCALPNSDSGLIRCKPMLCQAVDFWLYYSYCCIALLIFSYISLCVLCLRSCCTSVSTARCLLPHTAKCSATWSATAVQLRSVLYSLMSSSELVASNALSWLAKLPPRTELIGQVHSLLNNWCYMMCEVKFEF